MYSVQDLLVKAGNAIGGKMNARTWRLISERDRKDLQFGEPSRCCITEGYFPYEPIFIKSADDEIVISNSQLVNGMVGIGDMVPDTDDVLGYPITDKRHWVYSLFHFGEWSLQGYASKGSALSHLMRQKKSNEVFEAAYFHMSDSNKYIGLPTEEKYYYPVSEYLSSRYKKYLYYTDKPVKFDTWVVNFLKSLINSFIRENSEDSTEWYELRSGLSEYIQEYATTGIANYVKIFGLYDELLQLQYNGVDISDLFD